MAKTEWLVIVRDKPNCLAKRMEVRTRQHLSAAKQAAPILMGGATLTSPPAEGQKMDIDGSALLVEAESREEVVNLLEGDIYATSGVWDLDGVQIMPFKSAIRKGL
ncbi:hypothetical protein ANO11243_009080 [Dothideomycetidae sp. 11243]|nr:hypothetical protein ANO11243_009080 [fungal sp. No.11243]